MNEIAKVDVLRAMDDLRWQTHANMIAADGVRFDAARAAVTELIAAAKDAAAALRGHERYAYRSSHEERELLARLTAAIARIQATT